MEIVFFDPIDLSTTSAVNSYLDVIIAKKITIISMKQLRTLFLVVIILLTYMSCLAYAKENASDRGSVQNRVITKTIGDSGNDMVSQADSLFAAGRYREAEQLFRQALTYWDKTTRVEQHSRPSCLTSLGLLYANERNYDKAIPCYKQALSFEEKSLSANDPLIALTLDNLAQAYRLKGKLPEAEPLYLKALGIEQKSMLPDDQDRAITMFNLSLLYLQLKKYDKSEPLMLQSLAVLEKKLGENSPDYLNVYKYYLALLRKTNRSQQADVLEQQIRQNLQ